MRPEAERLLASAQHAYEKGEDTSVVRDTSLFLAEYPHVSYSATAHYLRGLSHFRQKEPGLAKEDLKAAAAGARRKDVRVGALKTLGDLACEEGDMDWAVTLYGEALGELGPAEKPGEDVRYRLGCALQHRGRWAEADRHFDRVVHAFAGTEAARRAEQRMRCTAWTVQAGAHERKDAADRQVRDLRDAGLSAKAVPVQVEGRLEFRVNVGTFETYEPANAALEAVRRLRQEAFVTPTR